MSGHLWSGCGHMGFRFSPQQAWPQFCAFCLFGGRGGQEVCRRTSQEQAFSELFLSNWGVRDEACHAECFDSSFHEVVRP